MAVSPVPHIPRDRGVPMHVLWFRRGSLLADLILRHRAQFASCSSHVIARQSSSDINSVSEMSWSTNWPHCMNIWVKSESNSMANDESSLVDISRGRGNFLPLCSKFSPCCCRLWRRSRSPNGVVNPSVYWGSNIKFSAVSAAPHDGLSKLLQEPSRDRYLSLKQRLRHDLAWCCIVQSTRRSIVSSWRSVTMLSSYPTGLVSISVERWPVGFQRPDLMTLLAMRASRMA